MEPQGVRPIGEATTAELLGAEMARLGPNVMIRDETHVWGQLVGSEQQAASPIHRWFRFRESFSPALPQLVVQRLGVGRSGLVVDPFAGVATTQLALCRTAGVRRAVGIEYSPLAHFIGATKLRSFGLDANRVLGHTTRLEMYAIDEALTPPSLSTFSNVEIWDKNELLSLQSAIAAVRGDTELSDAERDFFLLGIASVVEDASKAMKDGRALRILRGRRRRPSSLWTDSHDGSIRRVRTMLGAQWRAMASDLWKVETCEAEVSHEKGSALSLGETDGLRSAEGDVGLFLFSPPYLNALDYSEVYKLELWLLGFVASQTEFRALREGTLRSHPSITFHGREKTAATGEAWAVVQRVEDFLAEHRSRREVAPTIRNYLQDMEAVFRQAFELAEPGGHLVCIVGNSTFSRRSQTEGGRTEDWRLEIETDRLLAVLGESVGFAEPQILIARWLRPRNVTSGRARESVVVLRKPG